MPKFLRTLPERGFRRRARAVAVLFCAVCLGLAVRLFFLQVRTDGFYADRAQGQQLRDTVVPADRGRIYSADGLLLAANSSCWTLRASPREMPEEKITLAAHGLAEILELDEAALQQAVAHSGRTLELLQQAQAAKAGRNLHNDVTSEFYEVFVTHTMLGTPQAEQYARKLLADIEASPMGGGTRLLWAHAVPFYQAPVRERLNFSAENQLITCDMNADTLGCYMDPDKPFESMAARLVNNIFNGSAQHRIQRALELCRMQQIDGVVYFCQWGCKQTMGAAQLFKSALEAEGYPVLLLDGDGCDRANTMDGQTATRLDAFLEMLHSKQEALV